MESSDKAVILAKHCHSRYGNRLEAVCSPGQYVVDVVATLQSPLAQDVQCGCQRRRVSP